MTSRRLGLFSTLVAAGVLGVGSVAWACVPGHDHMTPEEQVAHGAAGAAPAAPAPAPPPPTAPTPAPSASATQAQPAAAPAPAAPSAPAAGTATRAAATPVTAAPARTAPAPRMPVTAAPAPAAATATQAPAAPAPAGQPAAPAAAPLVTTAPEVLPVTPVTTGAGLWEGTSVSQEPVSSSTDGGSSQRVLGYAVLGLGVALLLGAFVSALLGWRRSVGPPAVTD